MPNIDFKLSGLENASPSIHPPTLNEGNYESDHIDLIINGKSLLSPNEGGQHFRNAIFSNRDLLSIFNNQDGATDIMFSSIATKEANGSDFKSTITAIGTNIIEGFLYTDGNIYVSNSTNLSLNYSRLSSFDRSNDLSIIHNNVAGINPRIISSENLVWYQSSPAHNSNLKDWVDDSYETVNNLVRNGYIRIRPSNMDRFDFTPLIHGVFYNKESIKILLESTTYISLLPVTISVEWETGINTWSFPMVTYVLAPIKEENGNYFVISPQDLGVSTLLNSGFLISDTVWPERWEAPEEG